MIGMIVGDNDGVQAFAGIQDIGDEAVGIRPGKRYVHQHHVLLALDKGHVGVQALGACGDDLDFQRPGLDIFRPGGRGHHKQHAD